MSSSNESGEKHLSALPERRLGDLKRFYLLLNRLEVGLGGVRTLAQDLSAISLPRRGVYFFMENGEHRTDSGTGLRVVRVGTHAVSLGSKASLRNRLSQHRGSGESGGGNQRGSIFRHLIGYAIIMRNAYPVGTWAERKLYSARPDENCLEKEVSLIIRSMPFLWVTVEDKPCRHSARAFLEKNAIALLSNACHFSLDPSSPKWLGSFSHSAKIRNSGLWNQRHVENRYDPAFLDEFERHILQMFPNS